MHISAFGSAEQCPADRGRGRVMTWAGTKISLAKFMAGATGLEPATFGVTGRVLSNDSSGCSDFFHAGSAVFWHFPLVMFCKHSLQSASALTNQSSRRR